MLGKAEANSNNSTEMEIPIYPRLAVDVGSVLSANNFSKGYTCHVGLIFDPRPNGQYEVQYKLDGVKKQCFAQLFELATDRDGTVFRKRDATVKSITVAENANLCLIR